ncbi:MAG TPA: AbrB/MazE/SpoVT family DNA-binding domain-containing protein [Actinomycetota bacterium]|nr:AbrB/MazE/SpoVT family DNA-binding domain-containing protein [Actinomycetota bacterium]
MKIVVSEHGRVTIPKRLRESLGIRPGQVLDFEEEHGHLVARKAPREDPLDGLTGILHRPGLADDAVRRLRDET